MNECNSCKLQNILCFNTRSLALQNDEAKKTTLLGDLIILAADRDIRFFLHHKASLLSPPITCLPLRHLTKKTVIKRVTDKNARMNAMNNGISNEQLSPAACKTDKQAASCSRKAGEFKKR